MRCWHLLFLAGAFLAAEPVRLKNGRLKLRAPAFLVEIALRAARAGA